MQIKHPRGKFNQRNAPVNTAITSQRKLQTTETTTETPSTNLDVVVHGEVHDRLRVWVPVLGVRGQHLRQIVLVFVHNFVQNNAVFHALVEGMKIVILFSLMFVDMKV